LTLATVLLCSVFSAQAALVLSFNDSDVSVNLNDSFSLDLYVDTQVQANSILAWGLDVAFDNGIIALSSFTLGNDFSASFSADGDSLAGTASLPGVFGSNILLGTFNFTAIGLGATTLNTANTLGDIFEGFTTTNFFNPPTFNSALANITVSANSSGPIAASAPATLSLFALALCAFAGFRRKA
jgi:hypothetical protein